MKMTSRRWALCFILALSATSYIAAGLAQSPATHRPFRIGSVGGGTPEHGSRYLTAFREGMQALGRVEGRDFIIDTRYANGEYARLPAVAKEIVALKPDVILVGSEQALIAAKNTGAPIPIVAVACDPLEKLVGSLSRPGGNATGVTCVSAALVGRRLGYLKTLVPRLKRLAYFYNAEDDTEIEFAKAQADGAKLGITPIPFPVRSPEEFARAFDRMVKQHCEALYVSVSAFTNFHRRRLAELALAHRLPSINGFPEYPEAGGLISYGATLEDGYRRVAYFADRIFHGASPKELPVEEPTKFYLVINRKTAQKLKVKVPDSLMLEASSVLE